MQGFIMKTNKYSTLNIIVQQEINYDAYNI